jgi:dihydroflavonol-4-reductase
MTKRALVVGATGFLGYYAVQELLAGGWRVTALGLPPGPPASLFPASVKVVLANLAEATDADLRRMLRGHRGLVFAAGLDDRQVLAKPAYEKFRQANVSVLERLLPLAAKAGIERAVILGSYLAYFNRQWPDLKLAERHPYIRSRMEQEQVATSVRGLAGMVLEIPYVFGAMPVPGWTPLWISLVKYLRATSTLLYSEGGTACVSATVVGRAAAAALERGKAGQCYPIGQENLTWREMLMRLARADQRQVRVVTLPTGAVSGLLSGVKLFHHLQNKEGGLDLSHFASLQTAEAFIDPDIACRALGYELDDLDDAFRQTVQACR